VKEKGLDPTVESGKISSTRVYSGRVISVEVDKVRFPDGSVGELEMVRHSGASAVVPVLESAKDPRILLIRQYRYAANGYVYEIPAGRLNLGESPEDCAMRELREETGYSAKQLLRLTTIYTTPGFTDERIHLFVADGLTAGSSAQEQDEFLEPYPVLLSNAVSMIRSGDIVDSKTAVGLLLTSLVYSA
jgi:ADP-ribose pyrophosphatase